MGSQAWRVWGACALSACALLACDDGAATQGDAQGQPAVMDAGPADAAAPGLDGAVDAAAGDGAVDAGPADARPVDAEPDGTVDAAPPPCQQPPSARPAGARRIEGCRFARDGLTAPPRAVVVSTDSLARDARTPLHEAEHYRELAAAGVDLVWLLVFWEGLEPFEATFNGAYMGRVCQQVDWAAAAGLEVVLAVHQQGFGAGVGGVGAPAWASGGSEAEAWAAFWADDGAAFLPAWTRLMETCGAAPGVVGLAPLTGRLQGEAAAFVRYAEAVAALAEAQVGPLLQFWPPQVPGAGARADHGYAFALGAVPDAQAAPDPERAAGLALVGAAAAADVGGARAAATAQGWPVAIWADGFGGPFALRDAQGAPGPGWTAAFGDPWPVAVAGALQGWGPQGAGWSARWVADGTGQGVSRFRLAGRPAPTVALTPDGPFEWVAGHDPVADTLTVFVEGAVGEVSLTLTWEAE